MTNEEIIRRKRVEEDYYLKQQKMLPSTDKEASKRYDNYVSKDPFPIVEPALLNSADIFQYVAKTGMIYPFDVTKLEGASYEVAIRGKVIWWDEEEQEQREQELVKPEDSFELKPNSIAFVTLEPMFRIPDYMALRFNLKIVHVYKGLLLGTGPLVDPGFVGRLSIPLHNLTANTYTFKAGEGIIQMEFTKLSSNFAWSITKKSNDWMYKKKWIKPGRTVKEYIVRSLEGSSNKVVRSSIPKELQGLKNEVSSKVTEYEKKAKQVQWISIATIISIITGVVTIMAYACTTIYQLGSANTVKQERIFELEKAYEQLVEEYNVTKGELEERLIELEKRFEVEEETTGMVADDE